MTLEDETKLETYRRQFLEPDDDYSPMPFWFWNDRLEETEIVRQIRDFRSKGIAGFVIHPRLGLSEAIPYLSDAYMDLVEAAVKEAERLGMKVILYDEAMYPSGSAMGMVVRENPAFASRGLRLIELPCEVGGEFAVPLADGEALVSALAAKKTAVRSFDPQTVVRLAVREGAVSFDPPDDGEWAVLFVIETFSKGKIRGVYYGQDDVEAGAPPSADLLNPQATAAFIRLTHEVYYARLKRYFGSTVIAMFTDEPNILGRRHLRGLLPWTAGFLPYAERFGLREEQLPALWLEAGDGTEQVRLAYRKAVNARLAESFYRPLSLWCGERGIALTGHPADSDEIGLLDDFQLPGQDIVWRYIEPGTGKGLTGAHSTLGKCSADAARHRGRRRNLNECFGACHRGDFGWFFPADDMKWYMDWLFVRGVNLLSPHAFYYSIAGERKHERPPDVGPHSIWWPHYAILSGYMKRMSWLMTDSVNAARVAILCEEDRLPWKPAVPLYEHQIEFNYLEEDLFVSVCELRDGEARIAGQSYAVVIVDEPRRFKEATLKRLGEYARAGGTVIVVREEPSVPVPVMDFAFDIAAVPELPARIDRLVPRAVRLEPVAPNIRVSAVRKGTVTFYLFVNEGEERWEGSAELASVGLVEKWSPWEATTEAQPVAEPTDAEAGFVRLTVALERRESVIYAVDPTRPPIRSGAAAVAHPVRAIDIRDGWRLRAERAFGVETESAAKASAGADAGPARERAVEPAELGSWTEREGMEHYSGEVVYENEFRLEPSDLGEHRLLCLDLGDVQEMAEVEVNGMAIGVRFWKPYVYSDISTVARPGVNTLRIRVTNSLANVYNGASLPSGLFGPVTVNVIQVLRA